MLLESMGCNPYDKFQYTARSIGCILQLLSSLDYECNKLCHFNNPCCNNYSNNFNGFYNILSAIFPTCCEPCHNCGCNNSNCNKECNCNRPRQNYIENKRFNPSTKYK